MAYYSQNYAGMLGSVLVIAPSTALMSHDVKGGGCGKVMPPLTPLNETLTVYVDRNLITISFTPQLTTECYINSHLQTTSEKKCRHDLEHFLLSTLHPYDIIFSHVLLDYLSPATYTNGLSTVNIETQILSSLNGICASSLVGTYITPSLHSLQLHGFVRNFTKIHIKLRITGDFFNTNMEA